jgi:hypothetical protein
MAEQQRPTPRFHERFKVDVDGGESQRRFVNRVHNDIFDGLLQQQGPDDRFHLTRYVASRLSAGFCGDLTTGTDGEVVRKNRPEINDFRPVL